MYRTDLAINYAYRLSRLARTELFAQFQLLNVFNNFQLFNIRTNAINSTVLTAVDEPTRFSTFNPFTETPQQGVHWDFGDKFGDATGAAAYTLPRTSSLRWGSGSNERQRRQATPNSQILRVERLTSTPSLPFSCDPSDPVAAGAAQDSRIRGRSCAF